MGIPMLKIRRPVGRLIFNMGIAIPSKTVFLIETAPWLQNNKMKLDVVWYHANRMIHIEISCEQHYKTQ